GISWIRLHYAYPSKFPREIFDVMAERKEICNYLDIPLQHGSDAMLKRMRRRITVAETEDLLQYARTIVPDIAIRTTMLVGHPGETEAEFNELCTFVDRMRFERMGVFQYSHEEDTRGYLLTDDVSPELKAERANQLMAIQRDISLELNENRIGQLVKVLIDRKDGNFYYGRSEYDSPEVDNEIIIDGTDHYLRIGDFVQARVTEATEYDLYAELI
ncbi:MAG: radical SAM protein, partial [Bacteroidota bacterium]